MTFELAIDGVKVNQNARYLGQRSFSSKLSLLGTCMEMPFPLLKGIRTHDNRIPTVKMSKYSQEHANDVVISLRFSEIMSHQIYY